MQYLVLKEIYICIWGWGGGGHIGQFTQKDETMQTAKKPKKIVRLLLGSYAPNYTVFPDMGT